VFLHSFAAEKLDCKLASMRIILILTEYRRCQIILRTEAEDRAQVSGFRIILVLRLAAVRGLPASGSLRRILLLHKLTYFNLAGFAIGDLKGMKPNGQGGGVELRFCVYSIGLCEKNYRQCNQ